LNDRKNKILIYGYGNPGRQDDGLGVLLAEDIEKWASAQGYSNIHTDSNYQLNLEDAEAISEYDIVIFADASGEDINDFLLEELKPSAAVEFTMHAVSPAFILHLSNQVFDHLPEAYLLHIRGYKWEFMATMTENASKNLDIALTYLKKFLVEKFK
jgi:hydrogenase maturation protease